MSDKGTEPRYNHVLDALADIVTELRGIREALAPKYDIQFSPHLNLTVEQKRRMAEAAIRAMKQTSDADSTG